MTRANREHVPTGHAIGPSRAVVQLLIVAMAVVTGVVVGPVAHFSPGQPPPALLTVDAHLGHGAVSAALLTPASAQPAQTPGFGSVPGSVPDLLLTAALVAALLLALVRVPSVPLQAARALPQRRGPPGLAFTD